MKKIVAVICLFVSIVSCKKTEVTDPKAEAFKTNDTELLTYTTSNTGYTKASSGLYYKATKVNPAGRVPQKYEEVGIAFSMQKLDGTILDSTSTATGRPLGTFYLSGLAGLDEGIALMKLGEKYSFLLPSYLAFGGDSYSNLPAYSCLKFDIELKKVRSEDEQLNDFVTINKYIITEKTTSGLRYIRLQNGTGDVVKSGQTLEIKYNGMFLSKSSFDSGTFSYKLGTSGVIPGFEEGLLKMKVGEKAVIAMPSAIGYGSKGATKILPYTPLSFELEIVSAK